MKGKIFSLCLMSCLVWSLLPINCYAGEDDSRLGPAVESDLLDTYQKELELVEEICGYSIEHITPETRETIASVANQNLYHPAYQFSELMTAIACAWVYPDASEGRLVEDRILSDYREELDLVEELCGHPIEHITPESRKEIASVANKYLYDSSYRFSQLMTDIAANSQYLSAVDALEDVRVQRAYGPITGTFLASAPVSAAAVSGRTTVSVPADFFSGIRLSGTCDVPVCYEVSGPEQGAVLRNGLRATHQYVCAVVFGTVIRDGDRYFLQDLNGEGFVSSAALTARGTLYVDAGVADRSFSGYWVSPNVFREYLVTHPEFYLRGNA